MITEEKRPESLVAAVAPSSAIAAPSSASSKIDFTLRAEEYQGKLRLTATGTKIPMKTYIEVYQNGFPANPNTQYVKERQMKHHTEVFDTGLGWGSNYCCALMMETYDSQYNYQYIVQITT